MTTPTSTTQRYAGLECPLYSLIGLLGRKWTLDVLYHLREAAQNGEDPLRFCELGRRVQNGAAPRIAPKELTARLRELEAQGLVERTPHDEAVPRVEYALTARGHSLLPLLEELLAWGEEDGAPESEED